MSDIRLEANAEAELRKLFENPDEQKKHIENQRLKDLNKIRLEYVASAKSLAETWIGFCVVMAICQFIKPYGMHLTEGEFIAIVVSALGSVIALWSIVGKGLFRTD